MLGPLLALAYASHWIATSFDAYRQVRGICIIRGVHLTHEIDCI